MFDLGDSVRTTGKIEVNGKEIYSDGTVDVTNGSTAITGTDTAWLTNMQEGAVMLLPDGKYYEAAFTSDTAGVLSESYAGATASDQDYTAWKTYSLVAAANAIVGIASAYKGAAFLTAASQYWRLNQDTTADSAGTILSTHKADAFRSGMFGSGDYRIQRWDGTAWQDAFKVAAADGAVTIDGLSLDAADVGLGDVDNTSDADKPVSTATQTALDAKADAAATTTALAAKAPLASPTFTGIVTTAGQIKFPATQNASSDANTLDDYEEGTFTPAFTFTNGNTGVTYANQSGTYTKIGNVCTVCARVALSSKGSSTGIPEVTGFPFQASNVALSAIGICIAGGVSLASGRAGLVGYISNTLWPIATNGVSGSEFLSDTNILDAFDVRYSATYIVN